MKRELKGGHSSSEKNGPSVSEGVPMKRELKGGHSSSEKNGPSVSEGVPMKRELKALSSPWIGMEPSCFRRCPDEEGTERYFRLDGGVAPRLFQKVSR